MNTIDCIRLADLVCDSDQRRKDFDVERLLALGQFRLTNGQNFRVIAVEIDGVFILFDAEPRLSAADSDLVEDSDPAEGHAAG